MAVVNLALLFPRGHLATHGDIFGSHGWEGMPWASSRSRPGMLLNVPQCTGQSPIENYVAQNDYSAKVRNPGLN